MQQLREKIKIGPGDAAATGEDEEEGYGKSQRHGVRWNQNSPKTRPATCSTRFRCTKRGMERLVPFRSVPSHPMYQTVPMHWPYGKG
ncbi:S ribonuclease [Pyrus ussuriensis x Pyrus communis]|uniref:S ribonuclease n=1 Tax=Pyrus ussuriensis x Pyrus communis TaxID=2448454 RepID=A0A5N5G7Z1_9ROSA|nr:S ribonuclease [Pyrus ussuriensis x Pyrus communis]